MRDYKFIRDIEYNHLFELFFFSAIVTILIIRLYLQVTGFPQIGTGEFHIAHTLWGGLFMLLSIFGLLSFLNNDFKPVWAVLGGIGFGAFIDEIGKFITKDNDYFYQPTFSIIYVIFILLYFLYKRINHTRSFSQDEYLINSIEKLKDVIIKDLDSEEQQQAVIYLEKADKNSVTAKFLRQVFSEIKDVPPQRIGIYKRVRNAFSSYYKYFITHPRFLTIFAVVFLLRSLFYVLYGIFLTQTFVRHITGNLVGGSLIELGQLIALTMQAMLTVVGTIYIKRDRKKSYQNFIYALLLSILILQVFNFYNHPVLALQATIIDLTLLSILHYMMKKEDKQRIPQKELQVTR